MKRTVSILNFGDRLPLSFDIVQFDTVLRHMHSTAQLLLVLKGHCSVSYKGVTATLGPSGLLMIDPNTFHSLEADGDCILVSVLLDLKGFGLEPDEASSVGFRLDSSEDPENPRYESIRYLVYSMIKYNTMENANSIYTNRAIAYSFFSQLMNDFKSTEESKPSTGKTDTITLLTSYLEDHYAENISLAFLAKEYGYAVPYLSRLFKIATGKTYLDYYDELRVNYSADALLNTKMTMEEIAASNGFENARSYVRAFQKVHGEYPSAFREKHRRSQNAFQTDENALRKEALDIIISGYDAYNASHSNRESVRDTSVYLSLEAGSKTRKSTNPAHRILTVEKSSLLIAESVKNPLRTIQSETPFPILEILRFLEWDWPFFYSSETKTVNEPFLFSVLDTVLDLGFLPYVRLNYDVRYVNEETYVTVCKNLLASIADHYGEEKVKRWIIGFSTDGSIAAFQKPLNSLLEYAKSLNLYRFASPILPAEVNSKVVAEFFRTFGDRFDFFCYDGEPNGYLRNTERDLQNIRKQQEAGLAPERKTIIERFSFTSRGKELLLDTAYASSFLARGEIDLYTSLYALCLYTLRADEAFERARMPFSGGHSFLSSGIKKASCRALKLFGKLGKESLPTDGTFLATRTEKGLAFLFTNYQHYSDLYASEAYYELSETDRYRCFPKGTRIHYHLALKGIPVKKVLVKEYEVSKEKGSAFDAWIRMGAPKDMGPEEIKILRGQSELGLSVDEKTVPTGLLNLEFSLEPLGVKMIEVIYE